MKQKTTLSIILIVLALVGMSLDTLAQTIGANQIKKDGVTIGANASNQLVVLGGGTNPTSGYMPFNSSGTFADSWLSQDADYTILSNSKKIKGFASASNLSFNTTFGAGSVGFSANATAFSNGWSYVSALGASSGFGITTYHAINLSEYYIKNATKIRFDAPVYNFVGSTPNTYAYFNASGNLISGASPSQTLASVLATGNLTNELSIISNNAQSVATFNDSYSQIGFTNATGNPFIYWDQNELGGGYNNVLSGDYTYFHYTPSGLLFESASLPVDFNVPGLNFNGVQVATLADLPSPQNLSSVLSLGNSTGGNSILSPDALGSFTLINGQYDLIQLDGTGNHSQVSLYGNGFALGALDGAVQSSIASDINELQLQHSVKLNFNSPKYSFSQLTATTVPYLNAAKELVSSSITPTQLGYLSPATGNTGTGNLVFGTSPTFVTPVIGSASGTSLNLSGLTASQIVETDASKNLVSVAKGTAYNKAFGTTASTVTEGNDVRLSDARIEKTLFKSNVIISHTGTLAETIIYSVLIPANTMQANDFLFFIAKGFGTSSANNKDLVFYFNTSVAIAGATQVAINRITTGAGGQVPILRTIAFQNSLSSQKMVSAITSLNSDESSVSNSAMTTRTIDFSIDQYFIVTADLADATETMGIHYMYGSIKR